MTFFTDTGVKTFVAPFESTIQELGGQGWELVAVLRLGEDEVWCFTRPDLPAAPHPPSVTSPEIEGPR